ncbi:helix-turn-helix transcriptional regulator [Kitasatospora sp. NPDC057198]|uniref:helix-turn-helix transcriptional regulator n=1 Tax=Kitasatospora sp. NPDC057198 TaxID=3346046 RepID=UPI00362F6E8D
MAERRKALGYSQETMAAALGVATSTYGRWEGGKTDPQTYAYPKLARLLRISRPELVDLLARDGEPRFVPAGCAVPEPTGDTDDMRRRDVLSLLAVTGSLISLPRFDSSVLRRSEVDELVANGPDLNSQLWRVFALSEPKSAVLPVVHHQLSRLVSGLERSLTEHQRQSLCAQAGDLYQLVGEVFFDSSQYVEAAHCYTLAANAGREAGDFDMWACALVRHSFVELYERRFKTAAPVLAAAAQIAERGDPQMSTRHWVAAVRAETYAGLGDSDGCERALAEAEQVHDLSGRAHNGGWLRFDGSRLAEERGTCYLALGKPDAAEEALTSALEQGLSPRRRGAVLAELAALGAERGDLDQVLHYSRQAITFVDRTGSGYIGKKLAGIRPRLAPLAGDSRAVELDHWISALSGAV